MSEQNDQQSAHAVLIARIIQRLASYDGVGHYHLGKYIPNASDIDLLRGRTARSLARLEEQERERRLDVYRIWCEAKCDFCAWCGMRFLTIRDVVAIEGRLFHVFFCAERFSELGHQRVEITECGQGALGDDWEVAEESRALAAVEEKRAMYRCGVTGCARCNRSFTDLGDATTEGKQLVHVGCARSAE